MWFKRCQLCDFKAKTSLCCLIFTCLIMLFNLLNDIERKMRLKAHICLVTHIGLNHIYTLVKYGLESHTF